MAKTFRAFDPSQSLLLPPRIDDWLPDEHPARFIRDVVEELDLTPIFQSYEGEERGAPPYHPSMMVAVLCYGYMTGTYSSRSIQQSLQDSVPFRYIACCQQPDFRTISNFRRRHAEAFSDLFGQVVRLAMKEGLVDLRLVAIDGTKMKANASLERNRTLKQLQDEEREIEEFVRNAMAQADKSDEEEDERLGENNSGLGMPKDLADAHVRRAKIRKAIAEIEARNQQEDQAHEDHLKDRATREDACGMTLRGRKPKGPNKEEQDKRKANTTDAESRIMKNQKGFLQGFNAQAAVDSKIGMVVGAYVTNHENDTNELEVMLDNVKANAEEDPEKAALDAGYWNLDLVDAASSRTDLYVATVKDRKQREALRDAPPPRGRIPKNATPRDRMARKLRTKEGKRTYAQRSDLAEGAFGDLKHNKRMGWFHLRGLRGANAEWILMHLARNLAKMFKFKGTPA